MFSTVLQMIQYMINFIHDFSKKKYFYFNYSKFWMAIRPSATVHLPTNPLIVFLDAEKALNAQPLNKWALLQQELVLLASGRQ